MHEQFSQHEEVQVSDTDSDKIKRWEIPEIWEILKGLKGLCIFQNKLKREIIRRTCNLI